MIDSNGWIDWAIKMPGRPATGPGFNTGVNGVRGLVCHSAEGFAATMLSKTSQWGYYSADYPWHLSNLLDGRLIQHYPLTVRCWHGSAFNDEYVGMEHEGKTPDNATVGPVLNGLQIDNARHVITSLSEWKGWEPKRPVSSTDKTATLYEHTEVIRFGGSATQCPSKRIPWDDILKGLGANMQWVEKEHQLVATTDLGLEVVAIGDPEGLFPGRIAKLFGDKWLWLRNDNGNAVWSEEEGD